MNETIPDVPSDIYIIESVSYTEKGSLFGVDFLEWTSNGTYYYLYGYDTSGCEHYTIWEESYVTGPGLMKSYSRVLDQRTE